MKVTTATSILLAMVGLTVAQDNMFIGTKTMVKLF